MRESSRGTAKVGKMMEELSVTMQCDVCDVERMSEEEILACLVSDTEPKFTVRLFRDTDSDFSDPAGGFGCSLTRPCSHSSIRAMNL